KPNNNEPEEDPNNEPLAVISKNKTLNYLDNLVIFFENLSDVFINSSELSVLQKLRHQ
ncbi:16215_t:CDS:1, partial [Funneliformis geosporum]